MRRGRFAPSPTGQMHIGNARTALLAWLQMRSAGGQFVLRIEDIDLHRSRPEYARQIVEDLRWLGIDWDEGPDIGGPYQPYVQSDRQPIYIDVLDRLYRKNLLYPCYCSRADLQEVASAPHGIAAEGPVYPGTCRHLSPEERKAKSAKKEPSLRFALPDKPVEFCDLVAGPQHFPPGSGGDFIVKRADGMIGYQLAVVVDDAAMNITDVLRGADLLDSTPRQILLYETLGFPVPRFAHVPLLLGPDGRRLSKRHGDVTLASLRKAGTPPEKVIGFLAYLSGLMERPEPVTPAELIGEFSLSKISRSPVLLDETALRKLSGG